MLAHYLLCLVYLLVFHKPILCQTAEWIELILGIEGTLGCSCIVLEGNLDIVKKGCSTLEICPKLWT